MTAKIRYMKPIKNLGNGYGDVSGPNFEKINPKEKPIATMRPMKMNPTIARNSVHFLVSSKLFRDDFDNSNLFVSELFWVELGVVSIGVDLCFCKYKLEKVLIKQKTI